MGRPDRAAIRDALLTITRNHLLALRSGPPDERLTSTTASLDELERAARAARAAPPATLAELDAHDALLVRLESLAASWSRLDPRAPGSSSGLGDERVDLDRELLATALGSLAHDHDDAVHERLRSPVGQLVVLAHWARAKDLDRGTGAPERSLDALAARRAAELAAGPWALVRHTGPPRGVLRAFGLTERLTLVPTAVLDELGPLLGLGHVRELVPCPSDPRLAEALRVLDADDLPLAELVRVATALD